jgi:hypothetical protein
MQSATGTQLTLETTLGLRKWDQLLSSHFEDEAKDSDSDYQHPILFVAWMIDELDSFKNYGMLIRLRQSCVQGHELAHVTMRGHMELDIDIAHKDLADLIKTFTRPVVVRGGVDDRCFVCEGFNEEVSERRTLAEQPGDIIVIKLMDNAVSYSDIFSGLI